MATSDFYRPDDRGPAGEPLAIDAAALGPAEPESLLLLIYAFNPHGFAWLCRGNEHNIDLNRNGLDFRGPLPENPAYDALLVAVHPRPDPHRPPRPSLPPPGGD